MSAEECARTDPADLTIVQVKNLGRLMEAVLQARLASLDLTLDEGLVLIYCAHNPAHNAVQIAEALRYSPPQTSRAAQSLVTKKLLLRRRSRTDRRIVALRVSAAGSEQASKVEQALEEAEQELLQLLSPAQARSIQRAADRLQDGLS